VHLVCFVIRRLGKLYVAVSPVQRTDKMENKIYRFVSLFSQEFNLGINMHLNKLIGFEKLDELGY
jgi:hypothetical protein